MDDIDYIIEEKFTDLLEKVYNSPSKWVLDSMEFLGLQFEFYPQKFVQMGSRVKSFANKLDTLVDNLYNDLTDRYEDEFEYNDDIIEKYIAIFSNIDDDAYDDMVDKYTGIVYLKYFNTMKEEIETIEYTLYEILGETRHTVIKEIFE